MVLCWYLIPLGILYLLIRRRNQNTQSLVLLLYNAMFVSGLQICVRMQAQGAQPVGSVVASSLFSAIQNITFNGDFNWAAAQSAEVQSKIVLIALIASVITVYSVLLAFFGKLMRQFRLRLSGLVRRRRFILVGSAEYAAQLLDGIREKHFAPHVVYIPTTPQKGAALGGAVRVETLNYLRHLGRWKRHDILLLPDEHGENLNLLLELDENAAEKNQIHVTAFLANETIRYHDILLKRIDACLFSAEQLAMYRFFDAEASDGKARRPMTLLREACAFRKIDGLPYLTQPYEICVIGFGSVGQEFLLQSYENSAFLTEGGKIGFGALVLDADLHTKRETFWNQVPMLAEKAEITFVDAAVGTEEYYQAILSRLDSLRQILISTGEETRNVQTAWDLCRYLDCLGRFEKRPQIVVVCSKADAGMRLLLKDYQDSVYWLGVNRALMDYETLIERKLDSAAQVITAQYNRRSEKETKWEALGTLKQASNRAVIRDRVNVLALNELCGTASKAEDAERKLTFLAQYEHTRWCAFYYARGWKPLPVSELTDEEREQFLSSRTKEKRHICLVPWEQLNALPQKKPVEYQEYDRINIRKALE